MDNRFKELRNEYNEQLKDKNPKAKLYSVEDMCREMKDAGFNVSSSKIKKIESNQYGVSIDAETLLAYKWKFDVSADWLIDDTTHTRKIEGNIASASKVTGLSDATIKEIAELKPDYKIIFDKMISKYCFLLILSEIRNLLGYNYLRPHLKLEFDEKLPMNDGAEIDQYLFDAINDNSASTFFNEVVSNRIKQVVNNTINDDELKEYFGKIDEQSKIRGVLSAKYLPKLGNFENKGSDENETT